MEGVNVANQMPKPAELIQDLDKRGGDHRGSYIRDVFRHSIEKLTMPGLTPRSPTIYVKSDQIKDPFHAGVETMKVLV
jgi:hypothetical protein